MPPPNAPAAAANSNWKMAGKVLGGGGIVIFIVVAIVWFGLRPTGTLRLAMMAQVEAEQVFGLLPDNYRK